MLLTGATIALSSAAGHRVVLVVATDGGMDTAGDPASRRRMEELRASAALLGVDSVRCLGYADSGHGPLLYPDPPGRIRFARAAVDVAAAELADILLAQDADVLIGYDANGGYGHRDHRQVHLVARRAVQLAAAGRTVALLEATRPRQPAAGAIRLVRLLHLPVPYDPVHWYTPRRMITHHVRVGQVVARKQAALAMHRSQLRGDSPASFVLRLLVRLPVPALRLVWRREWFVAVDDAGTHPAVRGLTDIIRPR